MAEEYSIQNRVSTSMFCCISTYGILAATEAIDQFDAC